MRSTYNQPILTLNLAVNEKAYSDIGEHITGSSAWGQAPRDRTQSWVCEHGRTRFDVPWRLSPVAISSLVSTNTNL